MANNYYYYYYYSIKFTTLTCSLENTSVYYNTNTHIKHNNSANTQKQNMKQQNNMVGTAVQKVLGQKP
jgi:hypothetical protein